MRLAGIDFETSGLDSEKDVITEVGYVVWDTNLRAPVEMMSCFLDWKLDTLDPIITKLTGITLEMLDEFGQNPKEVLHMVNAVTARSGCEAFVAHNGEAFDRKFYGAWGRRTNSENLDLGWIDTQNDIPYGEDIKTRKLTHLAAEHDFLNPFAHRALFDVLTMFKVLEKYDIKQVLALSREPVVYLRAKVEFADRKKASERGYRWNPDLKIWWRSFKESQVAKERAECDFIVIEINKPPEEKR